MSRSGEFVYDDMYTPDEYLDEEWEEIHGYGYYISNYGRVWSSRSQQFMKPKPMDREGHLGVCLYINGHPRYFYIHRLIAEAFIPNPNNYPIVRHLDDDCLNNDIANLAWGTQRDNIHDSIRNGTSHFITNDERESGLRKVRKPVIAINLKTRKRQRFSSQTEAAHALGAQQANVHKVLSKKRKHTVGYSFEYEKGESEQCRKKS